VPHRYRHLVAAPARRQGDWSRLLGTGTRGGTTTRPRDRCPPRRRSSRPISTRPRRFSRRVASTSSTPGSARCVGCQTWHGGPKSSRRFCDPVGSSSSARGIRCWGRCATRDLMVWSRSTIRTSRRAASRAPRSSAMSPTTNPSPVRRSCRSTTVSHRSSTDSGTRAWTSRSSRSTTRCRVERTRGCDGGG